jgi:hypothetical protein
LCYEGADVRRVVANWPEYGGFVSKYRARERHPDDYPIETIVLNVDRAVLDLELLYHVGQVRAECTIKHTTNDGEKVESFPYPLNGITYCYHCELFAQQPNNPKLRSRQGGKGRSKDERYRHKSGVKCGCTNKSVKCSIFERDLGRLLQLLTVDSKQIDFMTRLGLQALSTQEQARSGNIESQKRGTIGKCRRRIDAARNLYEDGDLSREEYLKRKEVNEREIAHWEAQTIETGKSRWNSPYVLKRSTASTHYGKSATMKINRGWYIVRNPFTSITYDLDTQRIVDFRLKPWADRFITLRTALYEDENAESEGNKNPECNSRGGQRYDPNELSARKSLQLRRMINSIHQTLRLLYATQQKQFSVAEHNSAIYQRYQADETLKNLAYAYGISLQRVHQIISSEDTQSAGSSWQ